MKNNQEKDWKAGVALENRREWLRVFDRLEHKHVLINPASKRAVDKQAICIFDPEIYAKNREIVTFNNQKYRKFSHLAQKYNDCKNPNYNGCVEFEREFDNLIEDYFKKAIIRWATPEEIPLVQINPLNIIQTKENKFSLIIHSVHNARYSKPECNLMNILNRGQQLLDAENYSVEDMKSCYSEKSKK